MQYKTLDEIAFINPDSIKKEYPHSEIEYIDISSVGTGQLIETKPMLLSEASSRAKRLVKDEDTILSTVRPNRRSFLFIKKPRENIVVSTGFAVLRAKNGTDPRYLYYVITDQKFTDYLTLSAKGAAYPAVDTEIVQRGKVPYWSSDVQKKNSTVLSTYYDLLKITFAGFKFSRRCARGSIGNGLLIPLSGARKK
jgi:type I restriction enzyme S subunit